MNRTVKALADYPQLLDEIAEKFAAGESHVYLVADDGFAQDAQIWTVSDRDELLAQYARNGSSVADSGTYEENLERCQDGFASSREIFHVDPSDLAEARKALEDEN